MSAAIIRNMRMLAAQRGLQKTFCPSEVARALFPDDWRGQMPVVREVARQLASEGEVRILQSGQEVNIDEAMGPIRIQLAPSAIWKQSAFISREVKADSPFRQRLESAGWEVHGQSLIQFRPVPFNKVPEADWVFFYSKRAVSYFYTQVAAGLNASTRIAAIGQGTAEELRRYGVEASFIGNGKPEETARTFAEEARGQRVLFPQARHSRQSVQKLLGSAVRAETLVVYDNEPMQDVPLYRAQALVFTSPLNVEAYFSQHQRLDGQYAVAIGQPTAEALRRAGMEPDIARAPGEDALAKVVLEL